MYPIIKLYYDYNIGRYIVVLILFGRSIYRVIILRVSLQTIDGIYLFYLFAVLCNYQILYVV